MYIIQTNSSPRNLSITLHYRANGLNSLLWNMPSDLYRMNISEAQVHETFFTIVHNLDHKISLNKPYTKIIFHVVSCHNGIKLEINSKKKMYRMYAKIYKHTEIENTTLNDQQVIEKNQGKIKSFLESNEK